MQANVTCPDLTGMTAASPGAGCAASLSEPADPLFDCGRHGKLEPGLVIALFNRLNDAIDQKETGRARHPVPRFRSI